VGFWLLGCGLLFLDPIPLYYSISRVHRCITSDQRVIFGRAPVDYLAYSQYTANQGLTDIDDAFVRSMVPAVREALDRLDILASVPRSDVWPVAMEDDGIRPVDYPYRAEVDALFKRIYREGLFDVFPPLNGPLLIELVGSPDQRLQQLSEAVVQLEARST
jgi:hypothetical protein